ncbi:hypothetical protein [Maribacter sp. ACAM166]|uniref:hypothetical protein n=1 Tax=Maribacter sp. ACAM166 TaxID=2508996 RepID=UPI001BB28CDB|nr:hypothetical protein [Maribacter sp. ACAM166]
MGALIRIPTEEIIKNKEFVLAAGAGNVLGGLETNLVILGAILAVIILYLVLAIGAWIYSKKAAKRVS